VEREIDQLGLALIGGLILLIFLAVTGIILLMMLVTSLCGGRRGSPPAENQLLEKTIQASEQPTGAAPPQPPSTSGRRRLTTLQKTMMTCAVIFGVIVGAHRLMPSALQRTLGMKRLPASISNCQIVSRGAVDLIRYIYFEIDPQDFEKLIAARPYRYFSALKDGINTYPKPPDVFREIGGFTAAHQYVWGDWHKGMYKGVDLYADEAKRKVFIISR